MPSMEIELELNDETPFFIRPFPIKETEKDVVDKEMKKGCILGILKKGMSPYSSPIMLIPRKLTGIPRIVTDFRHTNSRLVTLQPSIVFFAYSFVATASTNTRNTAFKIVSFRFITIKVISIMKMSQLRYHTGQCSKITVDNAKDLYGYIQNSLKTT